MKNIIKVLGIATVLVLFFTSCDETFQAELTDEPLNKYSEAQVFSSPEGVETVVNGMYASLQTYDYYGARMRLLLWPHSGKYHSKQQANLDANTLRMTNTNINLGKLWKAMYQTINIANLLIKNLENTKYANKNTSLGQAHFIRAVVYFDLIRMFGQVPLRLQSASLEVLHVAKSSKTAVYNQIIKDFKKASLLLPTAGVYKYGRPLTYAAHAYLAKVYITLAGSNDAKFDPVKENEITEGPIVNFWEEAQEELDIVISESDYVMPNTYGEIFTNDSQNSTGAIFELQYSALGDKRTNDILRDVVLQGSSKISKGAIAFGRIRPNKEMFSDHIIQYSGLNYTNTSFIPSGESHKIFLDDNIADPRIKATYIYNSTLKYNGQTQYMFPILSNGVDAYTYLNKYKDNSYNNITTNTNIVLFRMSEIWLLKAEVENELRGPSTAYVYVNKVLERARTTKDGIARQPVDWNATSVPNQAIFRERIMKECEYEFNGEGHEWFDMRRRGLNRFVSQIKHHNKAVDFYDSNGNGDFVFGDGINPSEASLASEMYLPIPLSEISGNRRIE